MTLTFFIIIISVIICSIEVYSEFHIKNYGTFLERCVYLLSIKTLFIFFKLSCLFSFLYILFDLKFLTNISILVEETVIDISWGNWYLYFTAPFAFALLTIFSNSKELYNHLRGFNIYNERINYFLANLKYLIIRFFSFVLAFTIFKYVLVYMIKIHDYFISRKLYIFDWLVIDSTRIDNYNKGVYFSLTLTFIIFLLFNNAFIKKNSDHWRFREIDFTYFKYLFISLILGLGTFFGLFSIFNGLHNLMNTGISEWITKENVLGILPIRISSILIVYYLLTYIYSEVLHKKISSFLLLGILPIRNIPEYHGQISFAKRETLFFSQIGFYIVNIALAEYFIIIGIKNIFLSLLNFLILFILDDFKIINDYSNGLQRVMKWHFIRICAFNFLMLLVAILLLTSRDYYWILSIYLALFIILFRYYLINSSSISIGNKVNLW
jgi:hypothetical protein